MLISDWSSDVFSSDLSRSCKGTGMAIPPAALAAMAQFPAAAHDRGSMFTTVAHYTDPIEAHLARGRLLSEGIDAHLGDEHLAMANWEWRLAVGGVDRKSTRLNSSH